MKQMDCKVLWGRKEIQKIERSVFFPCLFACLFFSALTEVSAQRAGRTNSRSTKANDKAVRYVGRTGVQPDGSVTFDWVGTYLETGFTGGALSVRLSDTGTSYYNVFVDGALHRVVKACGTDTLIDFVAGISKQEHTLRIQKRTEGEFGKTTFHRFVLAPGGQMKQKRATYARHIEFIGNSITCGYGVEGNDKNDPFKLETENCDLSFAAIVARYFDADYTMIAHSGRGVVRNYGDSVRTSAITMKEKMTQTFDEGGEQQWSFKNYRPDLVVINLGTNDFSLEPHPYMSEFVGAYTQMLNQIRTFYGNIPILCIYCCTITAPVYPFYEEVLAQMKDKNLFLIKQPRDLLDSESDLGAVWHPNYSGQRKIAMSLIPYISTITGWELSGKGVQ